MPIQVKDYKWQETETLVNIKVPLKGVVPAKVDIFSTDDYLKVSNVSFDISGAHKRLIRNMWI